MSVGKRNRMTRAERASIAAACVVPVVAWPAIIALIRSLSPEWQWMLAAGGLGLFAFGVAAGLLTAVAGLIRRL